MELIDNWLVGIDPSINGTGVVVQNGKDLEDFAILIFCSTKKEFKTYSGLEDVNIFPIKSIDKKLYLVNRAIITSKIITKFIRVITWYRKCVIILLNYAYGASGRMASIGEFIGILKYELLINGHQIKSYAPTSIKKFASGKGNANKARMVECFLETEMGKSLPEKISKFKSFQDIADAYFILDFLKAELTSKDQNEIPDEYEKIFSDPFYEKMDYISAIKCYNRKRGKKE